MLVTKVFADLFLQSVVLLAFPRGVLFPSEFINFIHFAHFIKDYICVIYLRSGRHWRLPERLVLVSLLGLLDKYKSRVTLNWIIGLWFSDHRGMNSICKSERRLAYWYQSSGLSPCPDQHQVKIRNFSLQSNWGKWVQGLLYSHFYTSVKV